MGLVLFDSSLPHGPNKFSRDQVTITFDLIPTDLDESSDDNQESTCGKISKEKFLFLLCKSLREHPGTMLDDDEITCIMHEFATAYAQAACVRNSRSIRYPSDELGLGLEEFAEKFDMIPDHTNLRDVSDQIHDVNWNKLCLECKNSSTMIKIQKLDHFKGIVATAQKRMV